MLIVRQDNTRLRYFQPQFFRPWFVAFFAVLNSFCQAQQSETQLPKDSFDIKRTSFLLPQPLPSGKYSQAISLVYVVLPKDWTLDVINAPTFCYEAKYTLPAGFNLQGSFNTLIVSSRLNL